jgi:hypothetical protein
MEHSYGSTTTVKTGAVIRYGGTSGDGVGYPSSFIMEGLSKYEIYKNGGSFPAGSYAPSSEINNSGAISTPANFQMDASQGSYGTYVFNSPAFSGTTNAINNEVAFQDVHIDNTGTGRWIFSSAPAAAYTLTVNGDLFVAPGTIIDINKAASGSQATVIRIFGNADIQGTITETGGNTGSLIEMAGSADAFWGSASTALQNDVSLTIQKDQGVSVIANTDINLPASANAKLNLNFGILDMQTYSNKLTIQNTNTNAIEGGTVYSHIVGTLVRFTGQAGDYSFPVSNTLDELANAVIHSNSTNQSEWQVNFSSPNNNASTGLLPGKIDEVSDYFWNISHNTSGLSNASSITFYYDNLLNPGFASDPEAKVVYFDGASWVDYGAAAGGAGSITNSLGTNGGNTIDVSGVFAFGRSLNLLPINVEYFTGRRSGSANELSWKLNCTAGSSYNMSLQRSGDGRTYADMFTQNVDADRCLEPFAYRDAMPLGGKNYYRLALRDVDGRITYSQIVLLAKSIAGTTLATVYPNPAFGPTVTAEVLAENAIGSEILMTDILGRVVKRVQTRLLPETNKIQLDVNGLPAGSYQIILHDADGNKSVLPLIKK